ncbi:shikimate kinase [Microbacterium rhizomatis]|uniref:Shikimate kinase n=1 Tax=Microbacterium rhizomatis TaxID=1631477 RepID=A0A5J5J601_9MICO|nr:shikimate kinase [Microbacterium rhizomatis]KAA9110554.1 AAA family ATPase [Microbacterium rhizomatis]
MTSPDRAALVFVGPMGAGKSSIAKKVARELDREFTDTDTVVVRAHGPIPALFESHGEAFFRAVEREAVVAALATGGVVALGGGAVLDAATRADLAAHHVVLLTVSPDIVRARIGGQNRPLLNDGDPIAQWRRIYAERHPLYEEVADVTFDSSTGHISAIAAAIAEWARAQDTVPHAAPGTVSEGSE